jgi:hypothetical protein
VSKRSFTLVSCLNSSRLKTETERNSLVCSVLQIRFEPAERTV